MGSEKDKEVVLVENLKGASKQRGGVEQMVSSMSAEELAKLGRAIFSTTYIGGSLSCGHHMPRMDWQVLEEREAMYLLQAVNAGLVARIARCEAMQKEVKPEQAEPG